jgi:hypothetical protein
MGSASRLKKDHTDNEVEKIFRLIDNGKLVNYRNIAFLRPAYQYTKAEVGEIK